MKIIKDIIKLSIDVLKAIYFIFVNETSLSLLTNITNTPIIGIKSKDDNNIYKTKRTNTSVSHRMIMYHPYFL